MCSAERDSSPWQTQRQRKPLSAATATVCSVLIVMVSCAMQAQSWDLRVSQEFQDRYLSFSKVTLSFIENSRPTQLLNIQFQGNLLIFPPAFTFIDMEWKVDPGEFVTYSMNISSGNLSIMSQPMADVPLEGNLTNTDFSTFRTSLPCENVAGFTTLRVDFEYQVFFGNDTAGYVNIIRNGTATLAMRKACEFIPQPTEASNSTSPTSIPVATSGPTGDDGESGLNLIPVIGGGVGGVLILLLTGAVCYVRMERKREGRLRLQSQQEQIDNGGQRTGYSGYTRTQGNQHAPLDREEIGHIMAKVRQDWSAALEGFLLPRGSVIMGEEIGRGAFGRVLTGSILCKGDKKRNVAIKTLKVIGHSEDLDEFLAEAIIMKTFDHPNVIALMGVCIEGDEPPLVCLEMMHNGDLRSYLRRSRGLEPQHGPVGPVSIAQLLEFCAMVLDGMYYLAGQDFTHRDLATRNCMVSGKLIVKIGDFGLARDIHEADYYRVETTRPLPVKWMAFESLTDQVFNSKTDVWAFGVVMWEVFSLGQSPYPGVHNGEILEYLRSGRRLAWPNGCPEAFYNMMLMCWETDKDRRPDFNRLVYILADYREDFYQTVDPKMRDGLSLSHLKKMGSMRSGGGGGPRLVAQHSMTGSVNTMMADAPYADSLQYTSNGYTSTAGGSVGQYSKATGPTEEFRSLQVSSQVENPHYSSMPPAHTDESFNPNYQPTEPMGQPTYPEVVNSPTPANQSFHIGHPTGHSPQRGQLDLPSPVAEEVQGKMPISPTGSSKSVNKDRLLTGHQSEL